MKRYFTFLLIVFTLFLVACTPAQESTSISNATNLVVEPTTLEENALTEARTQLMSMDCGANEIFSKDNCYFQKAILFENSSYCEKIENEYHKNDCYSALVKCDYCDPAAICNTDYYDNCYLKKPLMLAPVLLPLHIDSEYFTQYCENISDQFMKDWCYQATAKALMEPSICEKIGENNSDMTNNCYRQYLSSRYIGNFDFDVCNQVEEWGQSEKENCWIHDVQARINCLKKESIPPFKFDVGYEYLLTCPYDVNTNLSNDPFIGEPGHMTSYEKRAVASSDEKICSSLNVTFSLDGCYAIVAVKKGDASICENIQTSAFMRYCKQFVAITSKP